MALTDSQKTSRLFKNLMGSSDASTARQFFEESIKSNFPLYSQNLWNQDTSIPTTAPGGVDGQITGVVQRWIDKVLITVPGTTGAFYHNDLKDCIPFNYGDGSYNYVLKDSLNNSIAFGQNDWVVDTVAGVLTFYGGPPANMPPKMSFYKYVGTKGAGGGGVAIDPWAPSTSYKTGNFVYVNSAQGNILYRCTADHTSSTNFYTDTANWMIISAAIHQYAVNEVFKANDLLLYQSKLYSVSSAFVAADINTETSTGLISPIVSIKNWAAPVYYKVGEYVFYLNKLFKCLVSHLSTVGAFQTQYQSGNWVKANEIIDDWSSFTYYSAKSLVIRYDIIYAANGAHYSGNNWPVELVLNRWIPVTTYTSFRTPNIVYPLNILVFDPASDRIAKVVNIFSSTTTFDGEVTAGNLRIIIPSEDHPLVKTTVQRIAYTPAYNGETIYDSDECTLYAWNAAGSFYMAIG